MTREEMKKAESALSLAKAIQTQIQALDVMEESLYPVTFRDGEFRQVLIPDKQLSDQHGQFLWAFRAGASGLIERFKQELQRQFDELSLSDD